MPKTTDITERGLESRICRIPTGVDCEPGAAGSALGERPVEYAAGWLCGDAVDYDAERCVDLAQIAALLEDAHPETADAPTQNPKTTPIPTPTTSPKRPHPLTPFAPLRLCVKTPDARALLCITLSIPI